MNPKRPAVRYYGGKWKLADWIISHLPPHECYVEPFGGAASVLVRKPRSPIEVYNDLNGEVINYFRVLREQSDDLVRALYLTPWSRAEYELARQPVRDDPLEAARRFYVTCWMGYGGGRARWRTGWRYQVRKGTLWKTSARSFMELEHLYQVAERFRGVQIECDEAMNVIRRFDAPTTLFYLDPPYLASVRSKWTDVYEYEMSDTEHERLAELARAVEGMVLISGYPSDLYAKLYEEHGWKKIEKKTRTNGGGLRTSQERMEALWISPAAQERQLPLFAYMEGETL